MFIYLHGWRQLSGVCDVPLGQSVPVLATTRWRSQGVSETQKRQGELTILITHFFHESDQTYGYRRIHAALVERGVHASPELVRQLMHQAGLVACQPRKRARTTIPAQDLGYRPDLVKQDCHRRCARGRNEVGDINLQPLPGKDSLI